MQSFGAAHDIDKMIATSLDLEPNENEIITTKTKILQGPPFYFRAMIRALMWPLKERLQRQEHSSPLSLSYFFSSS